ncbi:MAG: VanZ family protein [Vallitalea sp.]|jgi:glycopeptide antibiotics resistance protein|nr:VanZ family protein [Vallitalea sp.]
MSIIYSKGFKTFSRIICFILFIIYLTILSNVLFFNYKYGRVSGDKSYNLEPFKTINNYIKYRQSVSDAIDIRNILGNILAFMPMGFFIPLLSKKTRFFIKIIIISAITSLLVEVIQYKFAVGSFDVDDIILNTLGGFIGYICYKIAHSIYYLNEQ